MIPMGNNSRCAANLSFCTGTKIWLRKMNWSLKQYRNLLFDFLLARRKLIIFYSRARNFDTKTEFARKVGTSALIIEIINKKYILL